MPPTDPPLDDSTQTLLDSVDNRPWYVRIMDVVERIRQEGRAEMEQTVQTLQ
jgi:hypothetical protein